MGVMRVMREIQSGGRRGKLWENQLIGGLVDEALGEGHAAAEAEGFAGYFEAGGGLLALPLVEVDTAGDPADDFFVEAVGDDVAGGHGFLDVELQDLVEEVVWGEGVLVALIRF